MRQKSSIHLCQRPWRILLSQSCILTRKLAFCKSIWCGHAPSVLLLTTRSFFKIGISSYKLYQKYISIWGSFCDFYEIFAILANEPLQGPRHQNVFFQVVMLVLFMKKILFMIMVLNCILTCNGPLNLSIISIQLLF